MRAPSASASITCWQRRWSQDLDRARGRYPPLPWPLGCSQPVLLHRWPWSEGKVCTSQAIPGARWMDSTLYSEVELRALPVGPEDVSVGSVLKRATWPLHPFHSALRMPTGPPSSALEDSVPSSSFHPFPASSTPPADLSSPQSVTWFYKNPVGCAQVTLSRGFFESVSHTWCRLGWPGC